MRPLILRDPLDDHVDVLSQQNEDSDRLLDLSNDMSLALFMEHEALEYEAERQRYEADVESQRARETQGSV